MWSKADIVSPKADGMLVKLQRCYILLYPHSSAPPQRHKHCALPSLFQENSCHFCAALFLLPSVTWTCRGPH